MKKPLVWLLAVIAALLVALVLLLLLLPREPAAPAAATAVPVTAAPESAAASREASETEGAILMVSRLQVSRASANVMALAWPDDLDSSVSAYTILRAEAASPEQWTQIGELPSDGTVTGAENQWVDRLDADGPKQVFYRIDVRLPDGSGKESAAGEAVLGCSLQICLDPGHYLHSSTLEGEDLYGYEEGPFVLRLARELREILETRYGVTCVMTRTGDSITLGGYTDDALDNSHLSLRGEFAAGSDLFLSLHTNANQDDANGFPTCAQPLEINKTLVFVNIPGKGSDACVRAANGIGRRLSEINFRNGLASTADFTEAAAGVFHSWSDPFNDSLNTPGAVCWREGSDGADYYGVLRGAAAVGVPGLIVEHGFHTVAEIRKAAMQGDLARQWAQADAEGIAEAYGLVPVA